MSKNELSNYHQLGGVLYRIGHPINKTKDPKKKPFYILEVVLEVRESYYGKPVSTFAKFEIKDEDKFKMLDVYEEGDPVIVTFRVSGRKWKPDDGDEVVFNSLVISSVSRMPEQLTMSEEKPKDETSIGMDDIDNNINRMLKDNPPPLLGDDKLVDDDEDLGLPF